MILNIEKCGLFFFQHCIDALSRHNFSMHLWYLGNQNIDCFNSIRLNMSSSVLDTSHMFETFGIVLQVGNPAVSNFQISCVINLCRWWNSPAVHSLHSCWSYNLTQVGWKQSWRILENTGLSSCQRMEVKRCNLLHKSSRRHRCGSVAIFVVNSII